MSRPFFAPGANIERIRDRVFIASACDLSGTTASLPDGGTSWLTNASDGAVFTVINSHLAVMGDEGRIAITGASKISTGSGPTYPVCIGVAGVAINDVNGQSAWGLYSDVQHESNGISHGLEIAAKNASSNDDTATPYLDNNGVYGLWLAGGGDDAYGPVSTHPSNAGIVFIKNAKPWNSGIVFKDDSLTGTDGSSGSTGTGYAMRLARRHAIAWHAPDGSIGAEISSSVTQTGNRTKQVFENKSVAFYDNSGSVGMKFNFAPTSYSYPVLSSGSSSPSVKAEGTANDIVFLLGGKGAGGVGLYTRSCSALQVYVSDVGGITNDFLRVSGGINGTVEPAISSDGQENVPLTLKSKGTGDLKLDSAGGKVRFGTYTGTPSSVTGYITIKDSGGTLRKLAVLS